MALISPMKQIGLIIALAFALSACSSANSQKNTCTERDWFELGRHDGAQGSTDDKLQKYTNDCRKAAINADAETMYVNGRNAGLVEYCTPENAFELGRMGIAYMYVCPSTVEPKFLVGYRKGQRARELEIENKKIDGRIDSLSEKVQQSANDYERIRLTAEIQELQAVRSKNEQEMNKAYSKRQ